MERKKVKIWKKLSLWFLIKEYSSQFALFCLFQSVFFFFFITIFSNLSECWGIWLFALWSTGGIYETYFMIREKVMCYFPECLRILLFFLYPQKKIVKNLEMDQKRLLSIFSMEISCFSITSGSSYSVGGLYLSQFLTYFTTFVSCRKL